MSYSARYATKLARYKERLERRRSNVTAKKRRKPRARRRLAGAALGRCNFKALGLRCPRFVPKRGRLYCDLHFKAARAAAISRGLKAYHETKRLQLTAERDRVWSRSGSETDWMPAVAIRYRS